MCINIHNHHQKSVTAFAAFLGGKNNMPSKYKNTCQTNQTVTKCPYYGFLKMTFHAVTQLKVNENILQSVQSESAPCIKLLSLKRETRLWNIETSRF